MGRQIIKGTDPGIKFISDFLKQVEEQKIEPEFLSKVKSKLGKHTDKSSVQGPYGGTLIFFWPCGCTVVRTMEVIPHFDFKDEFESCKKHKKLLKEIRT